MNRILYYSLTDNRWGLVKRMSDGTTQNVLYWDMTPEQKIIRSTLLNWDQAKPKPKRLSRKELTGGMWSTVACLASINNTTKNLLTRDDNMEKDFNASMACLQRQHQSMGQGLLKLGGQVGDLRCKINKLQGELDEHKSKPIRKSRKKKPSNKNA